MTKSEDLDDDKTLFDYNIQDYSTLHLFDDENRLMEFLKIYLPKTTNVRQFLVLITVIIRITKMVKGNPYFYDPETLSKIFGLLEMFYQFQKPIAFNLPNIIRVKLMELSISVIEMLELY